MKYYWNIVDENKQHNFWMDLVKMNSFDDDNDEVVELNNKLKGVDNEVESICMYWFKKPKK